MFYHRVNRKIIEMPNKI